MVTFAKKELQGFPVYLKVLILLSIILGIFFRFYALDTRVYSNDETFSSLQIFGYDLASVIDGPALTVDELQSYQHVNPDESFANSFQRLISKPYVYPPLYPVLMQIWARFWSNYLDSPAVIQRSFSAAISLFALIGVYWLCLELSNSRTMAWIAVALIAISPFHVQYAQIVRTYSLTIVSTLLSSAMLLRAMRLNTRLNWSAYAVTVAFGLYSNLLFGFVAIAHGAYVLLAEKIRLSKRFWLYLTYSMAGVAAFLPWFYLFITRPGLLTYSVGQVLADTSLSSLVKTWITNISPIFLDIYDPWVNFVQPLKPFQQLLTLFILALVGCALYFVCRKASQPIRLLTLSLIIFGGLLLMLKDVVSGGTFSTRLRYMIPYVLGVEIAVSYLLASQLQSKRAFNRKISQIALTLLLLGGAASCGIISQANSWSAFGAPDYPLIAREINKASRPVVIFEDWGDALTMSYLFDTGVFSHLSRKADFHLTETEKSVYSGFSDVLLFKPSDEILERIQANPNYTLEPAFTPSASLPKEPNVWSIKER
jgi:uncharacterized membrane protein